MATRHKEICSTCGSVISPYIYNFDYFDCQLLRMMAKEVMRRKHVENLSFTQANKVHTTTLNTTYTARSRTTKCSKLGLIAKYRTSEGTQEPGMWLITARGWAALRNEPVPARVEVFRKQITERPGELTTIQSIYEAKKEFFDAQEWYEFSDKRFSMEAGGVPVEQEPKGGEGGE